MDNPWNSLEMAKLIVSCITPLIGGYIAWKISRIGKDLENKQWTDRKIIEKRLEIYEKLVPKLNDLYCFYQKVGDWKEITPPQVIELKRILDKDFHIYNHLFQWDILTTYNEFISSCFATYTGKGHTAKIKSEYAERASAIESWQEEWNQSFIPEEEDKGKVRTTYDRLLQIFRKELNLSNN